MKVSETLLEWHELPCNAAKGWTARMTLLPLRERMRRGRCHNSRRQDGFFEIAA